MAAASVLAVFIFLRNRNYPKWTLGFLVLLGALLQLGFGFMDGKGFESLRENYTGTMHRVYAEMAADDPDLLPVITDYEARFAGNVFRHQASRRGVGLRVLGKGLERHLPGKHLSRSF
jgi:hypothetical protein